MIINGINGQSSNWAVKPVIPLGAVEAVISDYSELANRKDKQRRIGLNYERLQVRANTKGTPAFPTLFVVIIAEQVRVKRAKLFGVLLLYWHKETGSTPMRSHVWHRLYGEMGYVANGSRKASFMSRLQAVNLILIRGVNSSLATSGWVRGSMILVTLLFLFLSI